MQKNNQHLELLRKKAEQLLFDGKNSTSNTDSIEIKRALQEVQIYQLELEIQNDELQNVTSALELQSAKLNSLFEFAPIGYFVLDKNGVILDVNRAGLNFLNYQKANLLNKPFFTCVYRESHNNFYVYINNLLFTGVPKTIQLSLINLHKEILSVQIEGVALNRTSEVAVCYLTITDITSRQKVAQQLKEANQTLEIALDASATGIWEIDIESGKFFLDDFCSSLYGFKPREFDGKYGTILELIHSADRKSVDESIRQTLENGNTLNLRFRINLPDKNSIKYIQARAQVIKDQEDKQRFIGTFTDITEKTLIEHETARIKTEQEQMILAAGLQAEENEKKRISEILHDSIAQSLYATKLNINQLKGIAPPETFAQLNDLLTQSIKDIRNISFELMPSILTNFGLAATLEDMASRLSNKHLAVITKVNYVQRSMDAQLQLNIFRMIQELVNNSIKHAKADKIMIEVTRINKTITITVADNGIGFTPAAKVEVPKGIGLSSIQNRLRLYKGTLKIESKPEVGTTIHIRLKH